jgi:hypothetical protein
VVKLLSVIVRNCACRPPHRITVRTKFTSKKRGIGKQFQFRGPPDTSFPRRLSPGLQTLCAPNLPLIQAVFGRRASIKFGLFQ